MDKVLNVAQFIIDEYKKITGTSIDELKLHKLLYFAQRESLAILGRPMFSEKFEGWKLGPVCKVVRYNFMEGELNCSTEKVSDEAAYILKNVILTYGEKASWKLSKMTHEEISWKNSRKGLAPDEKGNKELLLKT